MSAWTRRLCPLVLSLFAALPLGGPVCAALCPPAPPPVQAAADAGQDSPCHQPESGSPALAAAPGHDCGGHDGAIPQTAFLLNGARFESGVPLVAGHEATPAGAAAALVTAASRSARTPLRASPLAPPAATPLPLRI